MVVLYLVGNNGVLGRDIVARHGAAARGVHVRGPRAVGRAPPRDLPHALLRAHAAHAEGHRATRRYRTHAHRQTMHQDKTTRIILLMSFLKITNRSILSSFQIGQKGVRECVE